MPAVPVRSNAIDPYLKTFGPALLALGQLVYSLKTNGQISETELKTFGALALAAFSTWAIPAPGYSAPGQVAIDQNDPALRPQVQTPERYPQQAVRDIEDTNLPPYYEADRTTEADYPKRPTARYDDRDWDKQ